MGRPRKSAAALEAGGSFRKDPQRSRRDHGVAPGRPAKPRGLEPDEARAWDHLAQLAEQAHTLTLADGETLRQGATLLALWERQRKLVLAGAGEPRLFLQISSQVERVLTALGLSPRARTTVAPAVEPPKDDPLAAWMSQRGVSVN